MPSQNITASIITHTTMYQIQNAVSTHIFITPGRAPTNPPTIKPIIMTISSIINSRNNMQPALQVASLRLSFLVIASSPHGYNHLFIIYIRITQTKMLGFPSIFLFLYYLYSSKIFLKVLAFSSISPTNTAEPATITLAPFSIILRILSFLIPPST